MIDYKNYTFEELGHALYMKGHEIGCRKITDKTGWREKVVAEKLGHQVYKTISSGAGTDGEGSDAFDPTSGKRAEYKSQAVERNDFNNLFQKTYNRGGKTTNYVALKMKGVYNNAMKPGAISKYKNIDHYFGLFYRELCIMIIKVDNDFVVDSLNEQVYKRRNATSTNLCTVSVSLERGDLYDIVYKNKDWFDKSRLLEG